MKPVDVKSSTYIGFKKENSEKDPKFEVGDHIGIWKYKRFFAKCFTTNWSKKVYVIKKSFCVMDVWYYKNKLQRKQSKRV